MVRRLNYNLGQCCFLPFPVPVIGLLLHMLNQWNRRNGNIEWGGGRGGAKHAWKMTHHSIVFGQDCRPKSSMDWTGRSKTVFHCALGWTIKFCGDWTSGKVLIAVFNKLHLKLSTIGLHFSLKNWSQRTITFTSRPRKATDHISRLTPHINTEIYSMWTR